MSRINVYSLLILAEIGQVRRSINNENFESRWFLKDQTKIYYVKKVI